MGHIDRVQKILLASTFFIVLVLSLAVVGKLFYPNLFLIPLEISAALFEVVLIWTFITFYREWRLWSGAVLIFSAWAGYALFWKSANLPCSCLGSRVPMPGGISVALDGIFLNLCLFNLYTFGVRFKKVLVTALLGLVTGFWGFEFGREIFSQLFA